MRYAITIRTHIEIRILNYWCIPLCVLSKFLSVSLSGLKWTGRSNPFRTGPWPWPDRRPFCALPRSGPTVGQSSLHPNMDRANPSRADPWTGLDRGPCGTVDRTGSPDRTGPDRTGPPPKIKRWSQPDFK
jgi:hypothetical protein